MNVEVKGCDGQVSIEVLNYETAEAETHEDANWLTCYVTVKAGAFSAEYYASFTTQDFADFQQQLAAAVERLEGMACFQTLEDTLRLTVDVKSNGEVVIRGVARSLNSLHTNLTFEIVSDQSYLSETNRQLTAVMRTFPTQTFSRPAEPKPHNKHSPTSQRPEGGNG